MSLTHQDDWLQWSNAVADMLASNKVEEYLEKARQVAGAVPEPDDRKQLLDDLDSIRPG